MGGFLCAAVSVPSRIAPTVSVLSGKDLDWPPSRKTIAAN